MSYVRDNQCRAYKKDGSQCGGGQMPDSPVCGPHKGYTGKLAPVASAVPASPAVSEVKMVSVPISVMREMYKLATQHDDDLAYVIFDLSSNA